MSVKRNEGRRGEDDGEKEEEKEVGEEKEDED